MKLRLVALRKCVETHNRYVFFMGSKCIDAIAVPDGLDRFSAKTKRYDGSISLVMSASATFAPYDTLLDRHAGCEYCI